MSFTTTSSPAKVAYKVRKASRAFSKVRIYDSSLTQRISFHCNGNPREPLRKLAAFFEHNTADELVQLARMSEHARFLQNMDGVSRHVIHLHSLVNRGSYKGKVNNVANMTIATAETNRILGVRNISRQDAEVLDRLVLMGKNVEAREFANKVCYC